MSTQIFPYNSKFKENVEVPSAQNVSHAVNLGQIQSFLASKLDSSDIDGFVYDVTYNSSNHVLTFFKQNSANVVIDLPIEQLIKGVQLVGNDLEFIFEDGSIVLVPLNSLLVGVVKSVNGQTPDSLGEITLPAVNYFGSMPNYYREYNMVAGGVVPVNQAFYNLVYTNGVATSVTIPNHSVHGARLVLRGSGQSGVGVVYSLNAVKDDGSAMSTVALETGSYEFTWNSQLNAYRLTHYSNL